MELDFGGKKIINRILKIEFIYEGGDDDELAKYIGKNIFLTFSGNIGTTTELLVN